VLKLPVVFTPLLVMPSAEVMTSFVLGATLPDTAKHWIIDAHALIFISFL
jgi:hypothetical protein